MGRSAYDRARALKYKSGHAVSDMDRDSTKGSANDPKGSGGRRKPKATSYAPNPDNKRKNYGRKLPETAAEERKRKEGK